MRKLQITATNALKSTVKQMKPNVMQVNKEEFACGLIGSDIEAPNFDPFELSTGNSEETMNWYRASELKVRHVRHI